MSFPSYVSFGALTLAAPLVLGSPGDVVLVVAGPGRSAASAAEVVARAEGALLRSAPVPWVVLARSDAPDFAARLRKAGAWLVLDGSALAACAPTRRI